MSREDVKTAVQELRSELPSEVIRIGDVELDSEVRDYVSTQCPILDIAIGRTGIPVGRLTTIIGLEAAGKSTLGLHLLAETQRREGIAVLADTEKRYWKERAARLGVDQELLVRLSTNTVEETFDAIRQVIEVARKKMPERLICVVWDSIAGTLAKAELEADYGDIVTAPYGKTVGPGLRKLNPLIAKNRVAVVFINQLREVLDFTGFGRPKLRMVAEKPLTYWSSLKINLNRIKRVGDPKAPTGITVEAQIVKSNIAPTEGHRCVFDIDYLTGIDRAGAALDVAVRFKLVEVKAGGWYAYNGHKFQRGGFAQLYEEDANLRLYIEQLPRAWSDELDAEYRQPKGSR